MVALNDLVDFIQNNPPEDGYWSVSKWEAELTKNHPVWREVVADAWGSPDRWRLLEAARPRSDYDDLCRLFMDVVGSNLANTWFHSPINDQRKAVFGDWGQRGWCFDNLSLWSEFDPDMKLAVVMRLFEERPGEPYESRKKLVDLVEHEHVMRRTGRVEDASAVNTWYLTTGLLSSLATGYVPSPRIEELRDIVEKAGDRRYLDRVNDMIERREEACRLAWAPERGAGLAGLSTPAVPYAPNGNERELTARLMEMAALGGYEPAALPRILLSFEPPPIFISHPELEDEEDRTDDPSNSRIPRNRERRRPETISIEELLGAYQARHERIVLYERGIQWRRHGLDPDWLRAVVLIHEIGHWITHVLPKPGTPAWNTDLYVLGERDVHEGWAQLLTWWVADQVGGSFRSTFEKLNRNQSSPYRVFEDFKGLAKERVMASLEGLRTLAWPARLQDWRRLLGETSGPAGLGRRAVSPHSQNVSGERDKQALVGVPQLVRLA